MTSRLTAINIDCTDAERLATFWCAVLGWEVTERDDHGVVIAAPGAPPGALEVLFARVPEPKHVKNRLHFDVNPVDSDQAAELQRLQELGARPADVGQGEVSWHVLADPEGNEFCLLRRRVEPASGGA